MPKVGVSGACQHPARSYQQPLPRLLPAKEDYKPCTAPKHQDVLCLGLAQQG